MRTEPNFLRLLGATGFAVAMAAPAFALPTMIRIGYSECASCHISPQGGGPLNTYGRGIDKAQSLVAGDYQPSDDGFVRALNLNGRITHDLRAVAQGQARWVDDDRSPGSFRPRILYRNASDLGHGLRVSAVVTADGERAPRPALHYDPLTQPSSVFVNTALVHYRIGKTWEIAAGRDQLPSGVNVPDLGLFIKSRNRLGYYDAPSQLKMFWWSRRHAFTPFLYGPGGNELPGEDESGGGGLYEFDPIGAQRAKLGVTFLRGTAAHGDRQMVGAYARLGFGKWGILAEHDVTDRTRKAPDPVTFRQNASYGQIFWATREWLVASLIGERLHVGAPFAQHLVAGRLEVAARLTNQATIVANTRVERDMATGRLSKSVGFQVALKTID